MNIICHTNILNYTVFLYLYQKEIVYISKYYCNNLNMSSNLKFSSNAEKYFTFTENKYVPDDCLSIHT